MVEEVKIFFSLFQKVFLGWHENREIWFFWGGQDGVKSSKIGKITKEIKLSLFYRIFKKIDAICGQDQFDVIL